MNENEQEPLGTPPVTEDNTEIIEDDVDDFEEEVNEEDDSEDVDDEEDYEEPTQDTSDPVDESSDADPEPEPEAKPKPQPKPEDAYKPFDFHTELEPQIKQYLDERRKALAYFNENGDFEEAEQIREEIADIKAQIRTAPMLEENTRLSIQKAYGLDDVATKELYAIQRKLDIRLLHIIPAETQRVLAEAAKYRAMQLKAEASKKQEQAKQVKKVTTPQPKDAVTPVSPSSNNKGMQSRNYQIFCRTNDLDPGDIKNYKLYREL